MLRNSILALLLFCAESEARQLPAGVNKPETAQDVGALQSNFRSLESDILRLERKVLRESTTCATERPEAEGILCFDGYTLYVATALIPLGYRPLTVGGITAVVTNASLLGDGTLGNALRVNPSSGSLSGDLGNNGAALRLASLTLGGASLTGALSITGNVDMSALLAIGLSMPRSSVHISRAAGNTDSRFLISTGTTNLFEVAGTSVVFDNGLTIYASSMNISVLSGPSGGLRIYATSMNVTQISGVDTITGLPCVSGYRRQGVDKCLNTFGQGALIVSSQPVGPNSSAGATDGYRTQGHADLDSANAKIAVLRVLCVHREDGAAANAETALYVARGGNGITDPGEISCEAEVNNLASQRSNDWNRVEVNLNGNNDFDFKCRVFNDADALSRCDIYLEGYYD